MEVRGITAVGVMKKYGIKRSSFYKLAKQYEETKHKNLLND